MVHRVPRRRGSPIVIALLLAAALASGVPAPSARASEPRPARSGTVLYPGNYTGPSRCWLAPDCAAWVASGCDARLAGRDPAAFTSIVHVRRLAGSFRIIEAEGLFGAWLAGAYYEFWSRDCRRVGEVYVAGRTAVTIPRTAVWMTVPGQTGPYQWAMW